MLSAPMGALRVLCVGLLLCPPAYAFNATAHRVVAYVAAGRLCPGTTEALETLDPERSLAEAAVWADEIRGEDHWDSLKPYHYINVPDDVPITDAQRSRRGDVLAGIEKFAREMADPTLETLDRRIAYRLLVHFVADVHQPLHVGRKTDAGGNRVPVRVDGRRTNLHAYWDGYDLKRVVDDPRGYARYLEARFKGYTVPGGGPLVWAEESRRLRPAVYDLPPGKVPELTDSYREKYLEIINLRLYEAGVRLTGVLDAAFCTAD